MEAGGPHGVAEIDIHTVGEFLQKMERAAVALLSRYTAAAPFRTPHDFLIHGQNLQWSLPANGCSEGRFPTACAQEKIMPENRLQFDEGRILQGGNVATINFHSTGKRDTPRNLLEDMRKAIDAWSVRYKSIAQSSSDLDEGKDMQVKRTLEVGGVIDQLDLGPEGDQEMAVFEMLGLSNSKVEVTHCPAFNQKKKVESSCLDQASEETGARKTSIQAEHSERNSAVFSAPQLRENASQTPLSNKESFHITECTEVEVKSVENATPINHKQMDIEITPTIDRGQCDVIESEAEPMQERVTPTKGLEVALIPAQRTVDVVESPDWLPEGWITEVKTRSSGSSAGSKDKYYIDPVSRRRCRSKREVFSLLETGKLGRYKSRQKIQPIRKMFGPEYYSLSQNNVLGQPPTSANNPETSGMNSTASQQHTPNNSSGSLAIPSVAAPVGIVRNMFMPTRPGQPSEWLVHESMTHLPFPVFEQLRYAESKTNGIIGVAPRLWLFSTTDGSFRPVVDGVDIDKAYESRRDPVGFPHFAEPSSKRGRKSSKKNTVEVS